MNKIFTFFVLVSLLSGSGCRNRSDKNKEVTEGKQNEIYEYIVAPVGPQNTRNSEAAIVPLNDGSLLLAWTEFYAGNGADHGPAHISGKISNDGGRTWSDKYILVENDGGCNVMEVNFLRLTTGELALFYLQKNTESTDCRIMMRTSSDEGKTWINPRQLSPSGKYTGLTNGRSIRLRSGRILLEAWEGGYCYCVLSDDDGKTWRDSQHIKPAGGDCYENACIELKNGKVMMLMRTALGGQFESISSDGGETWSEPTITVLTGTDAPASISRIPTTGDLLVIWTNNPGKKSRNPLTSAISKDEGKTWEKFRNIEEIPDDSWAYPAVTWIGNRALVTYFNYKGGLSLKIKSLPFGWFYEEQ
ncbi:MAG: glycoside hydrolase [Bacteroidales bacterium]|nr:glycoside hydrolase [Bacteroidales bacterium]